MGKGIPGQVTCQEKGEKNLVQFSTHCLALMACLAVQLALEIPSRKMFLSLRSSRGPLG